MKAKTKIAVGIGLFVLILTLSIVMNSKQVSADTPNADLKRSYRYYISWINNCISRCGGSVGCMSACYSNFEYYIDLCRAAFDPPFC